MKIRNIAMAVTILLALAFTAVTGMAIPNGNADDKSLIDTTALVDDIKDKDVTIGPDHALYGLMIAWEKIGTTFTFDPTQKLGKQVSHARQRIAEAKAKLKTNDIKAAEKALEKYDEEMEEADETISRISNVDPELINMQLEIAQQQYVLEKLL